MMLVLLKLITLFMKNTQILKVSFIVWMVTVIIGSLAKIIHYYNADIILQLSIVSFLVFSCIAIYEVYSSTRIEKSEKLMWIVGIIFLGFITGIFYLSVGRKRIVNEEKTA